MNRERGAGGLDLEDKRGPQKDGIQLKSTACAQARFKSCSAATHASRSMKSCVIMRVRVAAIAHYLQTGILMINVVIDTVAEHSILIFSGDFLFLFPFRIAIGN